MTPKIRVKNPTGTEVELVLLDLDYDAYAGGGSRVAANVMKGSAADKGGIVEVFYDGKILLLGHVVRWDSTPQDHDYVVAESAEQVLKDRLAAFYRFPPGTTLQKIIDSLIEMGNGLVPRGSFVPAGGDCYKWPGAGKTSRLGTIEAIYQDNTLLQKVTSEPSQPGTWYQDDSDLYIMTTSRVDPKYFPVFIPRFKDTLVRCGEIYQGSRTFDVCFETGESEILPLLQSILLAAGLEYEIEYRDGRAWLNARPQIGKGSMRVPTATYIDQINSEIKIDMREAKVHALVAQGAGSGLTKEMAAISDLQDQGAWRETSYSAPNLYGSMLRSAAEKLHEDYEDPTIYNITAPTDFAQGVGNYVEIVSGLEKVVRRIKHLQISRNRMMIEAGQRQYTIKELIRGHDDIQKLLESFHGAHSRNAWSWSLPSQNIDSMTPLSIDFSLESSEEHGVIDPSFPYYVRMNVKVDWFKADLKSASTGKMPHGGVGGHGGYGGRATSEEEMLKHNISEQSISSTESISAWVYAYAGGGPYKTESHDHEGAEALIEGIAYVQAPYEDCFLEGYTSAVGNTSLEKVNYSPGGGWHLPLSNHTHKLPSHNTKAGDHQSHDTDHEDAKARAGPAEHPDKDSKLVFLITELPTGSAALLKLTVKCNGLQVPGSPFTGPGGLYIGDSLDVDLTDLVQPGLNHLTFELAEYQGSSLVKCSLSGNISVSAIISAF